MKESPLPQSFYALDELTRRQLVKDAIESRSSLLYRWENLAAEESVGWSLRAREAAKLVRAARSVVDLGCGMMTLERYLDLSVTYIPVDIVRRDERTRVVDLNREPLPFIEAECFVGLGLLEYIFDIERLMDGLARYRNLVISYNPIEFVPDREIRQGHTWVNHFSGEQIESLFVSRGYSIGTRLKLDANQYLWSFYSIDGEK